MSVPTWKRSISKMEFFHNALELRKELTNLLMRDFGIKNIKKDITYIGKIENFTPDELDVLIPIFEKHKIGKDFLDTYPAWLMDRVRLYIMDVLRNLISNITQANTIYPNCESEFYDRRNFQNHAIANCEELYQEMQYVISILPSDINKYMRYVDMIEKEIALLKGWRKSDNKILKRIQSKDKKN